MSFQAVIKSRGNIYISKFECFLFLKMQKIGFLSESRLCRQPVPASIVEYPGWIFGLHPAGWAPAAASGTCLDFRQGQRFRNIVWTSCGHRVAATFLKIMAHERTAVPFRTDRWRQMLSFRNFQIMDHARTAVPIRTDIWRQMLFFRDNFQILRSNDSMAPRWPHESFCWIFRFAKRSFRDSSSTANCICIATPDSRRPDADDCRIFITRRSVPYSATAITFADERSFRSSLRLDGNREWFSLQILIVSGSRLFS